MASLEKFQPANTYRAHAFKRGTPGVVAGELFLKADQLNFAYAEGSLDLSLPNLKMRLGGNNDEQLFIEDPNHPDWLIYTNELAILKDPLIAKQAGYAPQLKDIDKRQKSWARFQGGLAIIFFGLLALVVAAISQKSRMSRAIAARIPIAWEQQLGDKLYEQIKSNSRIVEPGTNAATVDWVKSRLLSTVTNSGFTFKIHVLEEKSVNAFAVPGGHIFIHTGLLRIVSRPEELAGVLAHEMAHVTQRHAFRKLIESSGLYLIVQYFLGDATGLFAALADSSQLLLRQKYSRDFEREADDVGWSYLVRAKIDPRGMIDFFEKLKAEEAKAPMSSGPAFELLNTHPSSDERIRRLKKLHPEAFTEERKTS